MTDSYVPTIVTSANGVAAVSLAAYDVETTRLRRQRNVLAAVAAVLALALMAALA